MEQRPMIDEFRIGDLEASDWAEQFDIRKYECDN